MITVILRYLRGSVLLLLQRMKPTAHDCMFKKGDVLNLDIQPKCIICGKEMEGI